MSYETACERPLGGVPTATSAPSPSTRARSSAAHAHPASLSPTTLPTALTDSVLNYSNGVGLAQNFAKANGCTWATPTSVTSGTHVCTNEMGCMAGYPLEFCSFNGDHTPDPDKARSRAAGNIANVWTFFSQF